MAGYTQQHHIIDYQAAGTIAAVAFSPLKNKNLQLFISALFIALALLFAPQVAHANPKYAAIVVDADTGKVLHEAHADATRHPASLTKMMTLYMTFEALEEGRLGLYQRLRASPRAAGMPSTNLSMKAGDTITVRDAIKALIVRSANDVAVVLAEAMGKTEWQFAVAMTNKARRKLGMTRTIFRNASGLPDRRQTTTARDMATLSLRLREDFPQYYHYFKTTQFTYKGRKYKTHNHVLKDVQGVDGLKTGYINMSGFNLASSIKKNGYSLVAIVLGGRTSKSRDRHMRSLLSRSMRQIASLRAPIKSQQFAKGKEPVPVFKPGTAQAIVVAAVDDAPVPESKPSPNEKLAEAVVPVAKPRSFGDEAFSPAAGTMASAEVKVPRPRQGWGIQVGAYSASRDAFLAAVHAMNLASRELEGSEITVSDPAQGSSDRVYRARIANITEKQARKACRVLLARKESCFVYREESS